MFVKTESVTAQKIAEVARTYHYDFRVIAVGDMINRPLFANQWWYVPRDEDESHIPKTADKAMRRLKESGIKVVGEIVAHEAPLILPPPDRPQRDFKMVDRTKSIVRAVAPLLALMLQATAYLAVFFVSTALLVDPALIAIVEDEAGKRYWLEVASWVA